MRTENHLKSLDTLQGYRHGFMDPALWEAPIRWVCSQHALCCDSIRAGLPGTYPTFIVAEKWVFKFFGPLFDGHTSFAVEKAVGSLLVRSNIPAPKLLFAGRLESHDPHWNYLIFDFIPGSSIGEVVEQVSPADKMALAAWLGALLADFHRLPIPAEVSRVNPVDFSTYCRRLRDWFTLRNRQANLGLPEHLARQCQAFLQNTRCGSSNTSLHLIHADITRDHILGGFSATRWKPLALIDYGDCMIGDLYYELTALHLDLFDCDRRLLDVFLKSYGFTELDERGFAQRCMTAALQHQFNVFGIVFERHPQLSEFQSLSQLVDQIWIKGL